MDQAEVEKAKLRLQQMRRDVLQEVAAAENASRQLGQDGVPDIGDMSSMTYERDVLYNLSEVQRQKVRDIDAALERLALGEYGVCARCGDEIAPQRMVVRPFSRFCVECKTDIEKFGE